MAKLYPPYLEGTLPAFSLTTQGNGVLSIPFVINKAVNYTEIFSAKIKIKTVQNDVLLGSVAVDECGGFFDYFDDDGNGRVIFYVSNWKLQENLFSFKIGQYYKIQLAFIDQQGIEGYYSTVGVVKCTSVPSVSIIGFDQNEINKNAPEFYGKFVQDVENGGDITEKVYSSIFEVFDGNGALAYTSEELLHNIQNDANAYTAIETYIFNREIPDEEVYTIKYTVTTTNGLIVSSPMYYITELKTYDTTVQGDLIAELNYDEGYIDLKIKDNTGVEFSNGTYLLSREDSLNPGYWQELTKFSINNEMVDSMLLFRDFFIEQGKYYTYSLQQYNENGLYTNRKKSNLIYADFEDIFIYDGKKQLKLRFNPQVNSFKTQLAETRTETIGSKYPFFFRNARIGYKTFPVSGLLSMLSDDNELFFNYDEIMREVYLNHRHSKGKTEEDPYKFTDLLSKNVTSERLFKIGVLDWLNDGKVKLFKSPQEGNYLVRLMDVSLSPENRLGRMLHNVSMTAYECDEINRANCIKYGLLKEVAREDVQASIVSEKTKSLTDIEFINGVSNNLFESDQVGAYTTILRLFDLMPGTKVELVFNKDGKFIKENELAKGKGVIITIGATGNYIADNITPIYGIYIIDKNNGNDFLGTNPTITYMGEDMYRNEFNLMTDVHTYLCATRQIVGESHNDIFSNLQTLNAIDLSKKEKVFFIDQIDIFKRPIEYVYYDGVQFTSETFNNLWGDLITTPGAEGFGYKSQAIDANLYLDFETTPQVPFTHKNMMDFAPFGLYVVKNLSYNGEKFSDHQAFLNKNLSYLHEVEHDYQHLLEKYFIDKILMATTAEEELLNTSLAYQKARADGNEEVVALLDENPLYVVDGWTGRVYKVGDDFDYTPSFIYNNKEISLLELEKYTLSKLEPSEDLQIFTNNGVYANVYYQKTITNYTLETTIVDLNNRKNNIDEIMRIYKKLDTWEKRNVKLAEYEAAYAQYVKTLSEKIDEYFAKL